MAGLVLPVSCSRFLLSLFSGSFELPVLDVALYTLLFSCCYGAPPCSDNICSQLPKWLHISGKARLQLLLLSQACTLRWPPCLLLFLLSCRFVWCLRRWTVHLWDADVGNVMFPSKFVWDWCLFSCLDRKCTCQWFCLCKYMWQKLPLTSSEYAFAAINSLLAV